MSNIASSHATIAGRQQPIRRELQRQPIAGAAAVQSSVSDLTRWMQLHLNNGVLDGKRFVSDSAMRELHSMQVGIVGITPAMKEARLVQDSAGYGLGWQVMDYRGHPLLWHTGNGDGQIAYMALLPRDRIGVVVLVNTWSAPLIHSALVNRILDLYLGYPRRDWAGEALSRVPQAVSAQDSATRAMHAMRSSAPPPFPLQAYAGRYDQPLFGPIFVRAEPSGLTLQMGDGQTADLDYHGGDTFFLRWRDPFFREYYGAHVQFEANGKSIVRLNTRINRDQFTATKSASGG
jgi:CubicO group peptidase (beta-lactamase class C family)